ncbi:hypothetical protein GCM10008959_24310 [Deinococcus seoulensis]|uniref:Type I restriction modification DNA specificity domain-containing protein n=1 Tax=Deinococcus seoulensis TaxID=1837379 RepID=A0ABQ2RSV5_9DEIO|nr:restriction endonuclease subunit S [Deinococcus seoulensis]GGR61565.1 hypothetical protein GCM10008959_24310 [Deinococcus seoulensis]
MNEQTYQLSQLGKLSQGLSFSRYIKEGGQNVRILQVANLDGLDVRPRPEDRQEPLDPERAHAALVHPGQVLIALRTTSLKAAVVPHDLTNAIASNSLTVLEVNPNRADPYFLAGLLRSDVMQRRVAPLFTGVTVQGIPLSRFKDLTVQLPPLDKQRAFVEGFRAIDAYRQEAENVIRLRDEELNAMLRPYALEEHA